MSISDWIQLIYTILTGGLLFYALRTYKSSIDIFELNNKADLTIQGEGFQGNTIRFTVKNIGHKCAKNIKITIKHDFIEDDIHKNKDTFEYLKSGNYFLCPNCKNSFIVSNKNYKNDNDFIVNIEYFNGYKHIKEEYVFKNKQIFYLENNYNC